MMWEAEKPLQGPTVNFSCTDYQWENGRVRSFPTVVYTGDNGGGQDHCTAAR